MKTYDERIAETKAGLIAADAAQRARVEAAIAKHATTEARVTACKATLAGAVSKTAKAAASAAVRDAENAHREALADLMVNDQRAILADILRRLDALERP